MEKIRLLKKGHYKVWMRQSIQALIRRLSDILVQGNRHLLMHLNGLVEAFGRCCADWGYEDFCWNEDERVERSPEACRDCLPVSEHQLFEETVEKDIMFGPMNFGVSEEEARRRAHELIALLGLTTRSRTEVAFRSYQGDKCAVSPLQVFLAFKPSVLVLDEPTAGLDPRGRQEIMELFHRLHVEEKLTTILVTHSMEDAARYADNIIVMHDGRSVMAGTPQEVFGDEEKLSAYRLGFTALCEVPA